MGKKTKEERKGDLKRIGTAAYRQAAKPTEQAHGHDVELLTTKPC